MSEMQCPKCGAANPSEAAFCGTCGNSLKSSGSQPPVLPPAMPVQPPVMAQSSITVQRSSQWANSLRAIKIFIDNFEAMEIRDGETRTLFIRPGSHQIFAKVDFNMSRVIQFYLPETVNKCFKISSPVQGAKMFIPGYTTVAALSKEGWLTLEELN